MKSLYSFLAGAIASVVVVYFAHASAAGFILIGFALVATCAALVMRRRGAPPVVAAADTKPVVIRHEVVHRHVRRRQIKLTTPEPSNKIDRSARRMNQVERDVVSALQNFGMKQREARAQVEAANMPAADFDSLFRAIVPAGVQ